MDHSTTFARHFARLVYLLLHEPKNIANQKAALRLLVAMSKEGEVTLALRDWQVVANGSLLPAQFEGAQDLGAQLIGHAVTELVAERHATAADLLGIARALATEPVPGDGGRILADKLAALGAKTVRVTLSIGARRNTRDVVVPREEPPPARRNTRDVAVVAQAEPPPPRRLSTEIGVMRGLTDTYLSQFAAPNTSRGSVATGFAQLDATTNATETTKLLDAVAGSAESAFRESDSE